MREKRAFTLIELMAVVIILGIISTITVFAINLTIQTSKQRLYVEQIERLTSSVRKWAVDNTEALPANDGGVVFFSVSRLKDEGIVDTEVVIDPRTNLELSGCVTIKYDNSYQQYDYKYEDTDCALVENAYLPVITVTGGDTQTVEVNGYYEFPTASSVDYSGRSITVEGPIIKKSGTIVTSLDSSLVNDVYELIYESVDTTLNLTATKTVTLTVVDTVAPIITVSSSTINHEAGDSFTPATVLVSDNSCGDTGIDTSVNNCITTLTPSINSGGFSPIIPGTYPIYYTATDSSGNIRVSVVNVVVEDTQGPNISALTYRLNTSAGAIYAGAWTKENVWVGNISAPDQGSGLREYRYYLTTTGDICSPSYGSFTTLPNTTTDFTITNSHNGKLCFWAVDNVFNPSVIREQAILIEQTAPTITYTNTSTPINYYNGTTFAAVINPVAVQDVTSGLATFRYLWTTTAADPAGITGAACTGGTAVSVTNGTVNAVSSTTSVGRPTTSGAHYLHVCTIDTAGNINKSSSIYYLDITIPTVTASNASTAWFSSRTTTVTATDNLSGIGEVRYFWNSNPMNGACTSGGTETTHNSVLTVPTGSNRLYICARDGAGNTNTYDSGAGQFNVDITVASIPTITVNEAWTNAASVAGTISGSIDNESGVLRYEYSMSGATTLGWTTGSSFSVTALGQTTVSARAINGVGTASTTTSKVVSIDRTAPVCGTWTPSISPWKASGGQLFTLAGSTDAGGSLINVSGGTCTTGTANGNTCTFAISDNATNSTTCTSPANRVDATAPSVPTLTVSEAWTNAASVAGTISGSVDNESGVLRYEYSMSGATTLGWTEGSSFTVTAAGQTTVTARAINGAGTASTATSKVVSIDRTPPSKPTVSLGVYTSGSWTANDVTITLSSTDTGGCSLWKYVYSHDNVNFVDWPTGLNAWTITWAGNWPVFYARALDWCGNESESSDAWGIRIDKTPPILTWSRTGSTTYSQSQCTAPTYYDNESGIATGTPKYSWSTASSGVEPAYDMPYQGNRCYTTTTTTHRIHGKVCNNAGVCTLNITGVFYVDTTNPTSPAIMCGTRYNSSLNSTEHFITLGADANSGVASASFSVLNSSGGTLLGGPYSTTTKWTSGTYSGRARRMVAFSGAAKNPIHLSSITITDNVGRTFSPANNSPSCGVCTTYPERCW